MMWDEYEQEYCGYLEGFGQGIVSIQIFCEFRVGLFSILTYFCFFFGYVSGDHQKNIITNTLMRRLIYSR
jgi:hypothetical protein